MIQSRAPHAICACGWHGVLTYNQPCKSCGRPATDRIDAGRLAALRAVRMCTDAPITPRMRIRLIEMGVIKPLGSRPPPADVPGKRPPPRHHTLTDTGRAVLASADEIEKQQRQGADPHATPS